MASTNGTDDAEARRALVSLSRIVREMTPLGARPIPATPTRFNLLARPYACVCRICNLPGHKSTSITSAPHCRVAIRSLLDFWKDQAATIDYLYSASARFSNAVETVNAQASYAMRHDGKAGSDAPPLLGGDMETVVVDRLIRNWLKCSAWAARVRPKMAQLVDMEGKDGENFELVKQVLNDFLLRGKTLSQLFEESLEGKEVIAVE